jgi:hypothetical protein
MPSDKRAGGELDIFIKRAGGELDIFIKHAGGELDILVVATRLRRLFG